MKCSECNNTGRIRCKACKGMGCHACEYLGVRKCNKCNKE